MRKYRLILLSIILGFSALIGFNACEDVDPIIEDLSYDRAFTPVGFKASIANITELTLKWSEGTNVDHYVVEIYIGTDFSSANLISTTNSTSTSVTYTLPAGDTEYSARIKSISSIEGTTESKWASVSFESGHENLFNGYSISMTALDAISITWTPGKEVSQLLLKKGTEETTYDISASEATAGKKVVTGISKGSYVISVLNNGLSRGSQEYLLEGDVFVADGENIATAISGASSGAVVVLQEGISFGIDISGGPIVLNNNIKIKGASSASMPTIYPATGASSTNGMFYIGTAVLDSIVFQNIILSGYINNETSSMITGIVDQSTSSACSLSKLKFNGSSIEHLGRHIIRLRGTANQTVTTVEVNDCIVNDFGSNSSSYGLINANNAAASIVNIEISNSTIYNLQCGLVSIGNSLGCESVLIDNCTCDQTMLSSTARYLIDFGTSTTSSAGTITLSDCIFGSTGINAGGVRNNLMTLSISKSYYTSDFVNSVASITSSLTAYSGASTALWTDPTNGVFTFLDEAFAGMDSAGDPRWK
ncbi:MAG: DUF5123 domain-containing protein [Bacteroidales bacterium]